MRAGAVQAAARLCESVAAAREPDAASLTSALDTLARILAADEARDTYALLKLPRALVHTVWPACAAHEDDHGARGIRVRVVAAASTRCEACKGAFVKASAEVPIVAVIRDRVDATALRAACDAARAHHRRRSRRSASGAAALSRDGQSGRGVRVDGRAGSASRRGKSRAPRRRRRHPETHRGERRHL